MADTKISALPASTVPLAGTEVLPIVQSSSTKQVSVANLTAGRAISATQLTLTTGNLIVANGQGIDFSATPSTGTSELFNDYEEGTWTPVLSSQSGSFTTVTLGGDTSAYYTKIGREVTFQMWFTTDAITVGTASGDVYISLPFTAATLAGAGDHSSASVSLSLNFTINHPDSALVRGGDAKMNLIYRTVANGGTSNLQVGSLATGAGSNIVVISGLYIAA